MAEEKNEPKAAEEIIPAAEIKREVTMTAANYAELKAGLIGADADFICSQLGANATLDNAKTAWMKEQNTRVEAANKAKTEAAITVGVDGVGNGGKTANDDADPIAEWNGGINKLTETGKTAAEATLILAKKDAELHAAYIEAVNAR